MTVLQLSRAAGVERNAPPAGQRVNVTRALELAINNCALFGCFATAFSSHLHPLD